MVRRFLLTNFSTFQCSSLPINHIDPDMETASRYSAELSNTDSGHGPSEEGDIVERVPDNNKQQQHHHQHHHHHHRYQQQRRSTETGPTTKTYNKSWNNRDLPHLHRNTTSGTMYPSLASHEQSMWKQPSGLNQSGTVANKMSNVDTVQAAQTSSKMTKQETNSPRYRTDRWNINSNDHSLRTMSGEHQQSLPHHRTRLPTDGSRDESDDDNSSASSGSFIVDPLHQLKSIDV